MSMRKDFPLNAKIINSDREVSIRLVATRQTRAVKFTPLKDFVLPAVVNPVGLRVSYLDQVQSGSSSLQSAGFGEAYPLSPSDLCSPQQKNGGSFARERQPSGGPPLE
ncbi:hypothetical protein EYF80_013811 [Liparis tanakae]|uniref:Uncharacterized protein n=1 Tax=Liparis tanakae TaxID=230148 RepID=A0A4Z2IDH3_9TELE|nr:hypothetical protein EYF80_013811 [Liparis tanakae]